MANIPGVWGHAYLLLLDLENRQISSALFYTKPRIFTAFLVLVIERIADKQWSFL